MKKFDVYRNPAGEYTAVKQGYCWPAFFFTWIWAFVSKLWFEGATLFIIIWATYVAQNFGENLTDPVMKWILILGPFVIGLSIMYYTGRHGNRWRRDMLASQDYEHIGAVEADTKNEAISMLND